MKKHFGWALLAVLSVLVWAAPASAQRPNCRTSNATEWTIHDGFANTQFVVGTGGDDVFVASAVNTSGRLVIFGLGGNDLICGSSGDDIIFGGAGNDIVLGRSGADSIDGGHGNDIVSGGRGADIVQGGPGNDLVLGGPGADVLDGGPGIDVVRRHRNDVQPDQPQAPPVVPTPSPTAEPDPTPDPTAEVTPEPTATATPTVQPTPTTQPSPTSEPTATPMPTPTAQPTLPPIPTPTPTAQPTATPSPTAVPSTPTPVPPTPTPPPVTGGDGLPTNHDESLALIREASATADERKAIVWDGYRQMSFPLGEGNPNEYTISADLNFNDYVHHIGAQYGPPKGRGSTGGVFHATCQFSHLAYDDPIVFPGQPGRSHLHMFFGNTHANAFSTDNTILNQGGSTCSRGELNRTSYWIPAAMESDGTVIIPDQFMVYYESYGQEWDTLQPFPEGLKLVNGNAMATSVQGDIPGYGFPVVTWKCGWYDSASLFGGGSRGAYQTTIPTCADSQYSHIEMQMKWPFCWDGQNLDSDNHKSHVVFPDAGPGYFVPGTCPSSHPITLPRITYRVHFATDTIDGPTSDMFLSSDLNPGSGALAPGGVSGHGDWFGGWNRDLLEGLVNRCILTGEECDEMHYGTPGGEQTAATRLEGRTLSPQKVLEYCPLRSTYDGDTYNVAYCRQ